MKDSAELTKDGNDAPAVNEATPLLGGTNGSVASPHRNGDIQNNGFAKHNLGDQVRNATSRENEWVEDEEEEEEDEERPMPVLQILLLCYASLAEPIAYFGIFPFISEMLYTVGGQEESNIGFYAGLIESLFSLVQMVLMLIYGRAADSFGRKPILVFSLAGISVFTALFGLSTNLWQMVLARCLAGVFAGSAVTIRTMLSENCTKESQARAFSWYMFTRNLGIFLGPLIGES